MIPMSYLLRLIHAQYAMSINHVLYALNINILISAIAKIMSNCASKMHSVFCIDIEY